jgi:hypothetical protein
VVGTSPRERPLAESLDDFGVLDLDLVLDRRLPFGQAVRPDPDSRQHADDADTGDNRELVAARAKKFADHVPDGAGSG